MTETQKFVDPSDLRKYRHELPNLVDDLGLSPYAYRLYGHIKRRCGASDGGACFEGARRMAEHCKMSLGMIVKAKHELEAVGLIRIKPGDPKTSTPDTISIVDIWAENFRRYQTCSPGEQPVHAVNTPVHEERSARSLHEHPCSPGERKKEPREERTPEENTHPARAEGAAEIYEEVYGEQVHIPGRTKIEAEGIDDLPLWREVVGDCFASRNPAFNVGKALHFYRQRREQKADRGTPRARAGPRQSNVERSMDAVRSFIAKEQTKNVR